MKALRSTAVALLLLALAAAPAPSCAAEGIEAGSADGRWILRADNARRELVALDAVTGAEVRRLPVADRRGRTSRVARLIDAAPRRSFIALLADLPETWELTYDPGAAPVFDGLVHDYRMGEGLASGGPFPVRRIVLDEPLADAVFTDDFSHFIARARAGVLHVVNLHVRRRIETVAVDGDVAIAGSVHWRRAGVIALRDRERPRLHLLDAARWTWREPIALARPPAMLAVDGDGRLVVSFGDGSTLRIDRR